MVNVTAFFRIIPFFLSFSACVNIKTENTKANDVFKNAQLIAMDIRKSPELIIKARFNPEKKGHDFDTDIFAITGAGRKGIFQDPLILSIFIPAVQNADLSLRLRDKSLKTIVFIDDFVGSKNTTQTEKIRNIGIRAGEMFYLQIGCRNFDRTRRSFPYQVKLKIKALEPDMETEPNNTAETAATITEQNVFTGYFSPVYQVTYTARRRHVQAETDWYSFEFPSEKPLEKKRITIATEGSSIPEEMAASVKKALQIDLTGVPGIDSCIELLDAQKQTIIFIDNNGADMGESIKNFRLPGFGKYYLKVYAKNRAENFALPYKLTYEFHDFTSNAEIEPNNTPEQANPIEPEKTYSGTFGSVKDIDFYRFQVSERSVFSMTVSPLKGVDFILDIFLDNNKIITCDHFKKPVPGEFISNYTLEPGNYYLQIREKSGRALPEKTYSFEYLLRPQTEELERENNNTIQNADTYSIGKKKKGVLFPAGDIDIFSLRAADADNYVYVFENPQRYSYTATLSGAGQSDIVISVDTPLERGEIQSLNKGEYYLTIRGRTDKTQDKAYSYQFMITDSRTASTAIVNPAETKLQEKSTNEIPNK